MMHRVFRARGKLERAGERVRESTGCYPAPRAGRFSYETRPRAPRTPLGPPLDLSVAPSPRFSARTAAAARKPPCILKYHSKKLDACFARRWTGGRGSLGLTSSSPSMSLVLA